MNAVAAGSSADGHDQVAHLRRLATAIDRDQSHGAAKHQRVAEIPLVKADGAINRGNAHAVAIIAHASDDAFHHLHGMQNA